MTLTKSTQSDMSLWGHLGELRSTLIRSILGILVTSIASYVYWREIWNFLTIPLKQKGMQVQLINTAPAEAFITSIKVALVAGILFASPWVLWNFWRFVAPGLFIKEKRMIIPVLFFSVVLFLAGAAFCYFTVLPFGLKFLANYTLGEVAPHWRQGEYASFILKILIAFGVTFELPIVSYTLTRMGLITPSTLISFSRYAIVLIFLLAAFLTPPDPITQIFLAFPLCIVYALSILISKMVYKPD